MHISHMVVALHRRMRAPAQYEEMRSRRDAASSVRCDTKVKRWRLVVQSVVMCFGAFLLLFAITSSMPAIADVVSVKLSAHKESISALVFSKNGQYLASCSSHDGTIIIWDVKANKLSRTLAVPRDTVVALAFSPNGRCLATGGRDRVVRVFEVNSGRLLLKIPERSQSIKALIFTSDGRRLVSADCNGTVKFRDATSGKLLRTIVRHGPPQIDPMYCMAFGPDGRSFARGCMDGPVELFDNNSEKVVHTFKGRTVSLAFSISGRYLAGGGIDDHYNDIVNVWDAEAKKLLFSQKGHSELIFAVALSPDAQFVASGAADGLIRIWDVHSSKLLRTMRGVGPEVKSLAFSSDGRWLASGGDDRIVHKWDFSSVRTSPQPDESAQTRICDMHPTQKISLLDGRLTVLMPEGADIEQRRQSIMSAPAANASETRVVLKSINEKAVLMAFELKASAGEDFATNIRKAVFLDQDDPVKPIFSSVSTTPDGLKIVRVTIVDADRQHGDQQFVETAFVANKDGLVQRLSLYVNSAAASNWSQIEKFGAAVMDSIAAGPKSTIISPQGTTLIHKGLGLTIGLPAGFLVIQEPGPDFEVIHCCPVVRMGEDSTPNEILLYLGHFPNFEPAATATRMRGKVLSKNVVWFDDSHSGTRQTILPVPDRVGLALHVIVSAPNREARDHLAAIAESMRITTSGGRSHN